MADDDGKVSSGVAAAARKRPIWLGSQPGDRIGASRGESEELD